MENGLLGHKSTVTMETACTNCHCYCVDPTHCLEPRLLEPLIDWTLPWSQNTVCVCHYDHVLPLLTLFWAWTIKSHLWFYVQSVGDLQMPSMLPLLIFSPRWVQYPAECYSIIYYNSEFYCMWKIVVHRLAGETGNYGLFEYPSQTDCRSSE